MSAGADLRDMLFESVRERRYTAQICARYPGILSGVSLLRDKGCDIGVTFLGGLPEGADLQSGTVIAEFTGTPKQLALCEESLLGLVAKPSGVATAAARARVEAGRIRVVCGAWKKMPGESKQTLRAAITTGGLPTRLVDGNFVYLDKNYVRMLGGIAAAVTAARRTGGRTVAIQIRGETGPIAEEAVASARAGATVVMVDTGVIEDVKTVSAALRSSQSRGQVRLAFAGGVQIEGLARLQDEDIDIVDIGRAVIDAPLLDMSMDVMRTCDGPPRPDVGAVEWK